MKYFLLLIITFVAGFVYSQINNPLRFPHQEADYSYESSSILGLPNGDLLFFWETGNNIYFTRSTNNGSVWVSPKRLFSSYYHIQEGNFITSLLTSSGRILLTYRDTIPKISYSDDLGLSWSPPSKFVQGNIGHLISINTGYLTLTKGGRIYFNYSRAQSEGVFAVHSDDDGIGWSSALNLSATGSSGSIVSPGADQLLLVYHRNAGNRNLLYSKVSTNNGVNWSSGNYILISEFNDTDPKVIIDDNGKVWIVFIRDEATPFNGITQKDIRFITSTDNGLTWSFPESFTKYKGNDLNHNITIWKNNVLVSFSSLRESKNSEFLQLFYGTAGKTIDINTPPYVYYSAHFPSNPQAEEEISFICFADGENGIERVNLLTSLNYQQFDTLEMFDDGLHADSLSGDKIYGITVPGIKSGDIITYSFKAIDANFNSAIKRGGNIAVPFEFSTSSYLIDLGRFKMPLNNTGVLANVSVSGYDGGSTYDGSPIIFSAGFYLSGKSEGSLWANAVASASRIEDYLPGPVGFEPEDPRNSLYILRSSDPHFGTSWQQYRYAVELGADFYDGDGDGIYNPVDRNGNGVWDLNEDRPDFIGDITVWSVYNDSQPPEKRRFFQVKPQGIEILQTAFAFNGNASPGSENIVYVRYRLINRGAAADVIDSVYFSAWADADIGYNYFDDYSGCDTTLDAGYMYKKSPDPAFGDNPPAIFTTILQGPAVYIPGETFIDNNGNGVFEPGIDTPLDTAVINKGMFLRTEILPGARNLGMSSFTNTIRSHPTLGDPTYYNHVRNQIRGYAREGNIFDPCSYFLGNVMGGVPCDQVNPFFVFSGDPVNEYGWINTFSSDQRMWVNTGPFQMIKDKPVDIIIAYAAGRGSNALNSIAVGKQNVVLAREFFKSGFFRIEDQPVPLPEKFLLYQNYPNPFNSGTSIRFEVPDDNRVKIKVYDILGREVKTLVDDIKAAGRYEIIFNASTLASGVYLYRLEAGSFLSTKKMVLIR